MSESLFTPIKIGPKTAENRFVINPMETNNADENGNPSEKTYERYSRLFEGNAGLIDLEAITITYENRARKNQLSIMPRNEKALKKFVADLKAINKKPIFVMQVTHSGEISSPDFSKRVCVKQMPGFEGQLLDEDDVNKILDDFVLSAKICHECGADGLELKFCHGYLGSQFLRPYNDRKWKYGGSKENRFRFGYENFEKIKAAINDPNFILGAKVTMYEGIPGGQGTASPTSACMDLSEPIEFCKGLEERGAQFIIETAGGPSADMALMEPPKNNPNEAYQHFYFTKVLKENLKPETVVVGSAYSVFRDGKNNLNCVDPSMNTLEALGNKNIEDGIVDMIAIGRQSIADPLLPLKMEQGRQNEIKWCMACDKCCELMIRQKNVGCVVHDKRYAQSLADAVKADGKIGFLRT